VMLLPHGQEGQGPEHSSARMERFLELCARDNMQVCNCSTPAQYFHVLRRQMRGGANGRGTRKPLIIFTPKSILRHPKAVSTFAEITGGGFQEVLAETPRTDVKRVVFCSGKVYYDLLAERDGKSLNNVAIARLEQIYPFAADRVREVLKGYAAEVELVWLQEEPRNMGAWRFVEEYFEGIDRKITYVGRAANSSPATGSKKRHDAEQAEIVTKALTL
jgi:2-oxoglutarate dehydrogenase complex dehydrogenase (E1) component-like enzyme